MPSLNSSSRPKVWPSSTFTTPSFPTFSIASAITSPISRSREEIVATRATSSLPEISFDCSFRFSTTFSTDFSIPRLSAIGFAPAATFFSPSRTIAWARTVAVVVPSPATSFVDVATSRTSCAPWFSKTSSTSILRAIVPPSFRLVGGYPDSGPAVLGADHLVALRCVHRDEFALVVSQARTDGEDAAPLRLLLRRVGQHDAAHRRLLLLEDLDDQAVAKRLQIHYASLKRSIGL